MTLSLPASARWAILAERWPRWRSPIRLGLSFAGVLVLVTVFLGRTPGFDFYAYWAVDPQDPYAIVDGLGAYHYAPPLVWIAGPLRLLPFDGAYLGWTVLMAGLLVWMTRSWALAWCAFVPVASELFHGNIHLLLAAALVVSIRWGGAWAIHVLSKVTTSVGLLWSVVRREWRAAAWAGVVTGLVVGGSVVIQGTDVWVDWVHHLVDRSGRPEVGGALIDISLIIRLPLAIIVVVAGATSGRRWTIPIAVTLAMPLLWFHSLAVLVALHPRESRGIAASGSAATQIDTNDHS